MTEDRQKIMDRTRVAHEQLSDWRAARSREFRRFCKEEIPKIYGTPDSEEESRDVLEEIHQSGIRNVTLEYKQPDSELEPDETKS